MARTLVDLDQITGREEDDFYDRIGKSLQRVVADMQAAFEIEDDTDDEVDAEQVREYMLNVPPREFRGLLWIFARGFGDKLSLDELAEMGRGERDALFTQYMEAASADDPEDVKELDPTSGAPEQKTLQDAPDSEKNGSRSRSEPDGHPAKSPTSRSLSVAKSSAS